MTPAEIEALKERFSAWWLKHRCVRFDWHRGDPTCSEAKKVWRSWLARAELARKETA